MKKLKVGVIGVGVMGRRLLEQFDLHPQTEIVGICDINPEAAQKVSNEFHQVPWTTDHQEIINHDFIDLVYIAVPPKFHHPIVMDAVKKGKHILCEKPLANSLQEAEEMAGKADQSGIIHAINFPTPYRHVFQVMKEKVVNGSLGEIKRIKISAYFHQWPRAWQNVEWIALREQGGFTKEVLPHFLQMTQHLFGELEVKFSTIDYPSDGVSSEQSLAAVLTLKDGTVVSIDAVSDIAMAEHIEFTLYGSRGTLSLVNWSELYYGADNEDLRKIDLEDNNRGAGLIDQFVKKFQGEEADLITFSEGLEVQKVLEQLFSSQLQTK
ncbi:Gfo/Idh/MocA family oxidoreductase [Fictibacillus sp. WQ 8-8]|uniref:Gfo/Idh/MocA family protein n=1 Tax=Fictibacillus sp. WQ 8-8 TaxID=2938788 RepID=UPI00210DF108|nr:Gfo/Idh/MocA family oxidoreductase [Fictibacillus sp. WQ 8-8]MCQ6268634.1 Gfo/Idh/MocA family oxidoreductase [Fictibacillus sp. WQ 8-8]